ncbi:MAG: polysaccharide biosynthesis tyrosine autokinase [Novosphingobium sp.]|nr:polysaccharide biosynthesis tyrosine autokinase [Novosphingobium sp.]
MATLAPGGAYRDHDFQGDVLEGDAAYDDFAEGRYGAPGLRTIVAMIRANLWFIVGIIVAALVIAVILTMLATPRYTATASVQVNEQADSVLGQGQDMTENVPAWDSDRFLQTQLDVLGSRGIAERVAKRLKLYGNADFYDAMGAEAPVAGTPQSVVRDETLQMLRGNLRTGMPSNSRIISISFDSTQPELSAKVANAFATEFIAANLQRKFDSSAYARNFVAEQLAEAKTRLEASELAVNSYARQAGLIRTRDALSDESAASRPGGSVTTASLVQLNQAANQARAKRIDAEGRWKALAASSPLDAQEVITNPSVQQLLTKRADIQTKLREERAKHLDDHPSVIQLRAQADEIERQLNSVVSSVRKSVRSDYEAALTAERDLQSQVSQLKNETLAEQQRSVQYNLLAREADTNRTIYDGLLQRYKELNAAAGITASNISIIDNADAPLYPSSPNLFMNLAIALLLGAGIAGLVVLLREQFDDSIKVPEDVESKLHVPLLGVIPKSDEDPETMLTDPKSVISESYNSLGGSLLYSTTEGLPEVLLVTSAQPSEGKSTTSFAIASGLARMGKKVVLIDMDLRRPSIHRKIGFDNSSGMSTLLTSHDSIDTVLLDSGQANLKYISSGPLPPSPTELIASPRMRALIEELASRFDVVIVDSSPILGLADAPLMSGLADGVLLIVEAGRGRRGSLKSSLRRLRSMRPVILGAVLTKFDPKKLANRYSEYYGYDYYQYRHEDETATNGGRG